MTYSKNHTEDECDKCLKKCSYFELQPLKFLFLDCNDKVHEKVMGNYHQYYLCKECMEKEIRTNKQIKLQNEKN